MPRFELDGKLQLEESPLSVGKLLRLAGVSIEMSCIKAADGTHYCDPDQLVKVRDGDKLESTKRPPADHSEIHYWVNGEEQVLKAQSSSLETILRNAGSAASIDISQLRSYFLEKIDTGSRYENLDDEIKLQNGDRFIAIHVGATPVA